MNKEGRSVWPTVRFAHYRRSRKMRNILKPLAIAALLIATPTVALAQQQGDKGRWHGYMPAGYIGAHPSNRGVHSCTWSASSYCANWRASGGQTRLRAMGVSTNAPSKTSNYCGANCQRKAFGGGGHCGANCQRKAAATFGGRQ
jgi:hypothetical protein